MEFIRTSDVLISGAALLLLLMSVFSWTVILMKAIRFVNVFRLKREAFERYENSDSTEALFSEKEKNLWIRFGASSQHAFHSLDGNRVLIDEQRKVQQANFLKPFTAGLGVLSTIAATAPFVGLFGTVVGIYHTMTSLSGISAVPSLAEVAGPVGETLIMTASRYRCRGSRSHWLQPLCACLSRIKCRLNHVVGKASLLEAHGHESRYGRLVYER